MAGSGKMRPKNRAVDAALLDLTVSCQCGRVGAKIFRRDRGVNAARRKCGSNFGLKFARRLNSLSNR
jgi:hypothetical protein